MSSIDIGPFRLVDPPVDQGETIRAAVEAIDFPWEYLVPLLDEDYDKAIVVEWGDTGQGVSGLYYGGSNKIVMSTRAYHLDVSAGFVFAHEVGHMIDDFFLDDVAQEQLRTLMHAGPGLQIGHFNHDHPDAGHKTEFWSNGGDAYVSRIYECFADQFVAAFAPTIWDGTYLPGGHQRYPRFVHWTDDHRAVREIVLRSATPEPVTPPEPVRKPMFRDVPLKHPKNAVIEKAVSLGLLKPRRKGYFLPGSKLTRAEAAEMAVALYEKRNKR